jgi:hypothetical protein
MLYDVLLATSQSLYFHIRYQNLSSIDVRRPLHVGYTSQQHSTWLDYGIIEKRLVLDC